MPPAHVSRERGAGDRDAVMHWLLRRLAEVLVLAGFVLLLFGLTSTARLLHDQGLLPGIGAGRGFIPMLVELQPARAAFARLAPEPSDSALPAQDGAAGRLPLSLQVAAVHTATVSALQTQIVYVTQTAVQNQRDATPSAPREQTGTPVPEPPMLSLAQAEQAVPAPPLPADPLSAAPHSPPDSQPPGLYRLFAPLIDAEVQAAAQPPAVPDHIAIPSLDLDAPVVTVPAERTFIQGAALEQWSAPDQTAAGWHAGSAALGVPGNTVLNGHNNIFGSVFARLVDLQAGDQISLRAGSRVFQYVVVQNMLLPERDASLQQRLDNARWILPSDDERLTLVSCWPPESNTHRVIVVAVPQR